MIITYFFKKSIYFIYFVVVFYHMFVPYLIQISRTERWYTVDRHEFEKKKEKWHTKRHPNSLCLRETFHSTRQRESCKLLSSLSLLFAWDNNRCLTVLVRGIDEENEKYMKSISKCCIQVDPFSTIRHFTIYW